MKSRIKLLDKIAIIVTKSLSDIIVLNLKI